MILKHNGFQNKKQGQLGQSNSPHIGGSLDVTSMITHPALQGQKYFNLGKETVYKIANKTSKGTLFTYKQRQLKKGTTK